MRLAQIVLFSACWALASSNGRCLQPPAKTEKAEPVAGYRLQKIEGFSFLVAEEVFKVDVSAYERKPLEVLELECKTLAKILSPKALDTLRALVVWVEWDDKIPLPNGRKGDAVAIYYSKSAAQMTKEGKHPLRAKTVTIHSAKLLTDGRQPKRDRGDCVLLHELAHAVHDQLLGYNHPGIKAAYQQAMERKLYDKELYIATNEREFFAELTCAYLDRLRYYPHTRADLAKHDPASFKVLESIWSASAKSSDAVKKAAEDGSDQFDLKLTLPQDIRFGAVASGPAPTLQAMSGKVVVIGYWGGTSANVLNKLDRMRSELEPYGLLAIAPSATVKTVEELKIEAEKRCEGIAVLEKALVKDAASAPVLYKSQPGGHALVFDHTGKCTFRGTVHDADKWVRAAVGRKLLADSVGNADPPAAFKPVLDAFAAGTDPVAVLPKISPLTNSQDEPTKQAAKKLSEAILAPGQRLLDSARANAKTDPVEALIAVEGVMSRYKNTPLASKAQSLAVNLRQEKAVVTELKARTALAQIQKVESFLRSQPGSFDPTNSTFQTKHRAALAQLQAGVEQIRKQFPTARATAEANKIAREYGID